MDIEWLKLIALVLIIEGVGPFLVPKSWQQYLKQMAQMSEDQLRVVGGILLLIGAAILWSL